MKEGLDLIGVSFQDSILACSAPPDRLPWFLRKPSFWLFSSVLLSWPLRILLTLKTAHVHFQVWVFYTIAIFKAEKNGTQTEFSDKKRAGLSWIFSYRFLAFKLLCLIFFLLLLFLLSVSTCVLFFQLVGK